MLVVMVEVFGMDYFGGMVMIVVFGLECDGYVFVVDY